MVGTFDKGGIVTGAGADESSGIDDGAGPVITGLLLAFATVAAGFGDDGTTAALSTDELDGEVALVVVELTAEFV